MVQSAELQLRICTGSVRIELVSARAKDLVRAGLKGGETWYLMW